MKIKAILSTIVITSAILIIAFIGNNGYSALNQNYIWIFYSIFCVLTLPSLIAKSLLNQKFFGFYSSLLFLIYPLIFVLFFIISAITGLDLKNLLLGIFPIAIIFWNYLLLSYLTFTPGKEIERIFHKYKYFGLISIVLITIFIAIRQPDSIVSLDYLQHQAVINSIISNKQLCLLPSECSNLFLQNGYTTIYHFILSIFGTLSSNSIEKMFYILDLVWWILGSLVFYAILSKYFVRRYALLGTLLTALVFTNWAYEFNFFIPQTLAFLFFLNFIYDSNRSVIKLFLAVLFLVLTHFVIGTYLAVFLIIYFLFSRSNNPKTTNYWIVLISMATANLAFLLHLSKFSFENTFQAIEIKAIGGATNALFPDSIGVVVNILGFGTIIFLLALTYYIFNKQKDSRLSLFIAFGFICVATYFVGPTYAAKFFIGLSLYSTILILAYLAKLNMEKMLFYLISIMLVVVYSLNFVSNYRNYLEFYRRENNIVSAISTSDKNVLQYLNNNNLDCLVISDPYTQLLVVGFTNYQTVSAQYMSIDTRKSLSDFVETPTLNNYRNLQNKAKKVSNKNICFLYTSRLQTSIKDDNKTWVNNIYQYLTDNRYPVDNIKLESFFSQNNIKAAFLDSFYILYK